MDSGSSQQYLRRIRRPTGWYHIALSYASQAIFVCTTALGAYGMAGSSGQAASLGGATFTQGVAGNQPNVLAVGEQIAPVPQPFYVHVDYQAGDSLLTGISQTSTSPFNWTLVSFDYTKYGIGGINTYTITLFDKNWTSIERILAANSTNIRFQYYYVDAHRNKRRASKIYSGNVVRWSPSFTRAGVLLTIEGYGALKGGNSFKKTRSWGGGEQRISDIVKLICEGKHSNGDPEDESVRTAEGKKRPGITTREGWDYEIEPTRTLQETRGTGLVTLPQEMEFIQSNEPDLEFIEKLSYYAITESEPARAGYRVYLDDSGERKKLYFKPDELKDSLLSPPVRTYTFLYGVPNEEVISFTPNVNADLYAGGAGGAIGVYNETMSKDNMAVETGTENADSVLNKGQVVQTSNVAQRSGLKAVTQADHHVEQSAGEAANSSFNQWYYGLLQGVTAELVLQGDPSLEVLQIIRILVLHPPSGSVTTTDRVEAGREIHMTSGDYIIVKITDSIEPGQFQTKLELQRWDYNSAALEASLEQSQLRGDSSFTIAKSRSEQRLYPTQNTPGDPASVSEAGTLPPSEDLFIGDRLVSPLPCGIVTSRFGPRHPPIEGATSLHRGVDIAAPVGTNIQSQVTGTVEYVGYSEGGGNFVTVTDSDGTQYWYFHMQSTSPLKPGQQVTPTTVVGTVGSTGVATGPHLHLAVKQNGQFLDPEDFFYLPNTPCT